MAHTFLGNKDAGPLSKVSVGPVASDVKQCELERFQYGSDGLRRALANKDKDEVELLTAGRYIDMDCGVRFGIIGEPVADDKVKDRK